MRHPVYRRNGHSLVVRPHLPVIALIMILAALIACSGGSSASPEPVDDQAPAQDADNVPQEEAAPPESEADQPVAEDSPPAAAIDPCAILTPDDVATLFGEPAGEPTTYAESDTVFDCTYWPGENATKYQTITFRVRVDLSQEESQTYFEISQGDDPSALVQIDGLGDAAYFDPQTSTLNIQTGVYWVIINSVLDGKDVQAELTALAPALLARLP